MEGIFILKFEGDAVGVSRIDIFEDSEKRSDERLKIFRFLSR